MWNLFKITNFWWLLSSTYVWITATMSLTPILVVVNVLMIVSLNFLPIKIEIDKTTGKAAFAMIGLVFWAVFIDGPIMGIVTMMSYMPVFYLLQLPADYKRDLLRFCTKWYSIALGCSLVVYWLSLFMPLPSIGMFTHPVYPPFTNHVFYIKTTFDYGTFERFNAFFLEPGHQALLSSFLMMANGYRFRRVPYLYILAAGVLFSFSLAGYLLSIVGFLLLKVNNVKKLALLIGLLVVIVAGALNFNSGDNAVNELIVTRLEYDESRGIKGNNRYFNNTDDEFKRAFKKGDYWTGVKNKANMELIGGAGFKIYILKNGVIGVLFALLFYLSLIPPRPNIKYTVAFFLVLVLCFASRAYPSWYSWLLPFVLGIYIAKDDKDRTYIEQQAPRDYQGA